MTEKTKMARWIPLYEKSKELIFKNKLSSAMLAVAFFSWLSIISFGSKFYADEKYHYRQIKTFLAGKFEVIDMLTTIPGYHAFMSFFAALSGDISVMKVRIISFALALLILPVFFFIAKKFNDSNSFSLQKTALLAVLPISFIYFPLVYTDLFSALLFFCSFLLIISGRYHLAALISIASVTTRQNNIVWHVFLWVYPYFSSHGFDLRLLTLWSYLKKTYLFPIGIAAFGLFVFLNGGIAIGDKGSHQAGFYLGNIYFFLAISAVLFAPYLVYRLTRARHLYSGKMLLSGLFVGLAISASFLLNPPMLHGYNLDSRFLRNIFLGNIYHGNQWLYALMIFVGYLALHTTKLREKSWIIYPFSFLYLLPSWLIEQRYSIIPLMLLLLFKEKEASFVERIQLIYFATISGLLLYMILATKIFF